MPMCDNCRKMHRAKQTVEPHSTLVSTPGGRKYSTVGSQQARIEKYQCTACGTKWQRDVDERDPMARWDALS